MPKFPFRVEVYPARRGVLLRRQWRARVVSAFNGEKLFASSESYNNRAELVELCEDLFPGVPVEQVLR
jgi:hypothetical protein